MKVLAGLDSLKTSLLDRLLLVSSPGLCLCVCALTSSSYKDISHIRSGATLLQYDLILIVMTLLQIISHSEALGIWTSLYKFWRGHNSAKTVHISDFSLFLF